MLKPLPPSQWNHAAAGHLLSRAGFGGPPEAVRDLLGRGLDGAVDSLVNFQQTPDPTPLPGWAQPDPERMARLREYQQADPDRKRQLQREERQTQRERIIELRAWWLRRMVSGPRPLQEKLVLFWHGHFATSVQKVRDPYLMFRQNEVFRQHAAGNWLDLLTAVSKDPAMLIWLDQAQSRKAHPNENFAREVMELFALGEGHYTEQDVLEAARAFTGWSYDRNRQEFVWRPRMHDSEPKTLFGKTGAWDGDAVLEQIVRHPQANRFISRKLWVFFASENPSPDLVESLAQTLADTGQNFRSFLSVLFRSAEFYGSSAMGQQVKSPVQWLAGSVRLLERSLPPSQVASNSLALLGQELFAPPNVKGWDGGLNWITTNNLLNRYNLAEYLVLGVNPVTRSGPMPRMKKKPRGNRGPASQAPVQVQRLLGGSETKDQDQSLRALEERFVPGGLKPARRDAVRAYLASQGAIDETDILHAIRLIMSTPEYQLT